MNITIGTSFNCGSARKFRGDSLKHIPIYFSTDSNEIKATKC